MIQIMHQEKRKKKSCLVKQDIILRHVYCLQIKVWMVFPRRSFMQMHTVMWIRLREERLFMHEIQTCIWEKERRSKPFLSPQMQCMCNDYKEMNVSPLLLTLSNFPLTISMNHNDKNWDGKDLLDHVTHPSLCKYRSLPGVFYLRQFTARVCIFISATRAFAKNFK